MAYLSFVPPIVRVALLVTVCCRGAGWELMAAEPAPERPATVKLTIDYGDGVQKHFTGLPWQGRMTVLEAMLKAHEHPRGIRLKYRGKGATALVLQIDDVANEGGRGRNWIYQVNGQPANRSCGIFVLNRGDTILWKFETYR